MWEAGASQLIFPLGQQGKPRMNNLEQEVRLILKDGDLDTITLRTLREELVAKLGKSVDKDELKEIVMMVIGENVSFRGSTERNKCRATKNNGKPCRQKEELDKAGYCVYHKAPKFHKVEDVLAGLSLSD